MNARDYAARRGMIVMLYPAAPHVLAEGHAPFVIEALKEIFGAWRWPRMG